MKGKKVSESKNQESRFRNILENVARNPVICLSLIGFAGAIIRFYYFPYDIPVTLDALSYFWYAMDMSVLGHFPQNYDFPNNGWPSFISIFFFFYKSENFLEYMELQRYLSVIISILTIIPVYLLCKRFFNHFYSLIGSALFVLEPRIIQNSFFGITEPFYIILGSTALFLFLSRKISSIYTAFGISALFTLVRYEGILLVIVFSIIFFLRFKISKKTLLQFGLALFIFIIILLPMLVIRMETSYVGQDGVMSHTILAGPPDYYKNVLQNNGIDQLTGMFYKATIYFFQYLGWVMIPFFIFIPYGVFMMFRKQDYEKTTIIVCSIAFLLPALYVYSRGIQETRYFYIMYPIFAILSLFFLKKINEKFQRPKIIGLLTISFLLFSSILFLYNKDLDYEHEREAFKISEQISQLAEGVNKYYPESEYLEVSKLSTKKFPIQNSAISSLYCTSRLLEECNDTELKRLKENPEIQFVAERPGPRTFSTNDYNSIIDFIKSNKENGLTHLVLDGREDRKEFLNHIFFNEEEYPYLIKEFDSNEHGFRYHVKLYKINYEKFDSIMNSQINQFDLWDTS